MRYFLIFLTLAFVFPLIGSYLGALHPLGDSLAVFRWHFAFGLMAVTLMGALCWKRRRIWWALLVLSCAWISGGIWFYGQKIGTASDFDLVVYQKNMSYRMVDWRPLKQDILSQRADIVTLQEVEPGNRQLLSDLAASHPSRAYCRFAGVGGVAIASSLPRTDADPICIEGEGMIALQVETVYGPLWIVSLHLHWPYPFGQAAQVERLLPHLTALDGPVLVAGDFNMVPWSHVLRSIEDATNTERAGHLLYTFPMKRERISLPIDHVLIPGNNDRDIRRRPLLGSDHYGVVARFTMPR